MHSIRSRQDLQDYIKADSVNYREVVGLKSFKTRILSNPISDQYYIWRYIITLRYCEYYYNQRSFISRILLYRYLHKLRKYSRITGFQIPLNCVGKGLTIWHWGPIIINPAARIGENCTLYPGVLIGHKNPEEAAPIIGNNVFLGSGAKVIGNIRIGDNCIIGQNVVVTKTIPSDSIVVMPNPRYLIINKNEKA